MPSTWHTAHQKIQPMWHGAQILIFNVLCVTIFCDIERISLQSTSQPLFSYQPNRLLLSWDLHLPPESCVTMPEADLLGSGTCPCKWWHHWRMGEGLLVDPPGGWAAWPGGSVRPVRLAYQPPTSSIFLSEQISHQQPVSSTFLSEQTSISHQPPAKRTGW
jgi:hypothetical protein